MNDTMIFDNNDLSKCIQFLIVLYFGYMNSKEETKKIIKTTLVERGANFVALFGSFAREEEKQTSDIDILVNFKNPISLFDHAGIELEEKTGKKIDLITERGLSKYIRPFITKELVTLYERR